MLQTSLLGALPGGTTLGARYRIIRLLGQGGMSRVYLAEDTRLGVEVAVKENLQTSPEARRQFEREAHLLARLSHPNLPRVSDHFTDPGTGRQYLVMDYVEGEDLKTLVERTGALPEQTALAWVGQVLDALEYLHRQQPPVIHRDVKPGNIKITPQGKAVLVDFGIAKVGGPALSTLTGARAVTPGYAPPEQYGMRTTERSDIYALGATLYTMLTGRVPPEAPLRMAGEQLVPPRRVAPAISQPTQTAVLRAMEMETNKRWESIATLRRALQEWPTVRAVPHEPQRAVPRPVERPARRPASITVPIILIVLVVLAISAGAVFWPRIVSPTLTPTPMAQLIPGPTAAPVPMATATSTPTVTNTPLPTPVPVPSTPTPLPPTLTPESPTPTPAPVVIVQGDKVNVRKGPGTAYPTLGQATKGASLEIVGKNVAGDWWQVCCISGQQVWIIGQLVQVQGDTSDVMVAASIPTLPPPTSTPRLQPTPVPQFHVISLAGIANATTDDGYESPPSGRVNLSGVPFDIPSGLNSVTTQANTLPNNPVRVSLTTNIARPLRVYLLITGGNLFVEYLNKQTGVVYLGFEGNQWIPFPLTAGQNIREWKILHDDTIHTATSPDSQQVWSCGSKHGGVGVIDMLTLEIPGGLQSGRLLQIIIEDTSVETCGSLDPAINLLGVTVVGVQREQ